MRFHNSIKHSNSGQKFPYHIAADAEAHVRGLDLAKVREVAFLDEHVENTAEHAD